jgi:hypothetical protein
MDAARLIILFLSWAVGIPLEVLVIRALLRNGYRKYPVIFLYLLVTFVITIVNIPLYTQSLLTHDAEAKRLAAKVYWIGEGPLQVLIFATVFSLIDQAIVVSRRRHVMRLVLAAGALLFAGITFWIHYQPPPVYLGLWMSPWMSELSLCATVLDLALWMILIASRKSDRNLLLICGALGMQFTAEAIGSQISAMAVPRRSLPLALLGSVVTVAGSLICLYVWWQTFRNPRDGSIAR